MSEPLTPEEVGDMLVLYSRATAEQRVLAQAVGTHNTLRGRIWRDDDLSQTGASEIHDDGLREALRFIDYLWDATGVNADMPVNAMFGSHDPIREDIDRFRSALHEGLPEVTP